MVAMYFVIRIYNSRKNKQQLPRNRVRSLTYRSNDSSCKVFYVNFYCQPTHHSIATMRSIKQHFWKRLFYFAQISVQIMCHENHDNGESNEGERRGAICGLLITWLIEQFVRPLINFKHFGCPVHLPVQMDVLSSASHANNNEAHYQRSVNLEVGAKHPSSSSRFRYDNGLIATSSVEVVWHARSFWCISSGVEMRVVKSEPEPLTIKHAQPFGSKGT